jgi:two-component system, NarL family, nitrate/nitrite response regulator NarL
MASDPVRENTARPVVEGLSARKLEVLRLVTNGCKNSEIGDRLGLSIHAVKFHLASAYRKLGVANRTEAAVVLVSATAARGEGM